MKSDWQPISTAPKDGSHILVSLVRNGVRIVGKGHYAALGYGCRKEWFVDAVNSSSDESPTHWMALPEPPQ
jgi:hypothetical protein